MSKRAEYLTAPDGLPARVVGPWVARKVQFVDNQTTIFATGMKNRWEHRAYVELFAGPGLSYDRVGHEFIAGSAIRALDRNFTHYAFVDIDRRAVNALREDRYLADSYDDPIAGLEAIKKRQLTGNLGQPEDVAEAALFLAGDESGFVLGSGLFVDGGVRGCK